MAISRMTLSSIVSRGLEQSNRPCGMQRRCLRASSLSSSQRGTMSKARVIDNARRGPRDEGRPSEMK